MTTLTTDAIESLLAPIPGASPVGPSLRHEPIYQKIREARRSDDPTLPLGVWQTELKRADWDEVGNLARAALSSQSKDLMLAAWLGEAWMHQRGSRGLVDALELLCRLCERYWDQVHPQVQDEDIEYRISPLAWVDENYALTVRCHLELWHGAPAPGPLTLDAWQTMERRIAQRAAESKDPQQRKEQSEAAETQLQQLKQSISSFPGALDRLQSSDDDLDAALRASERLEQFLAGAMGEQSATFYRLRGVLESARQVIIALSAWCPTVSSRRVPQRAAAANTSGESVLVLAPHPASQAPYSLTRDDAYRLLAQVATVLAQLEPHSPVPYLIRKAVEWGNKPLNELLEELHEGDPQARRLWTLMGLFKR